MLLLYSCVAVKYLAWKIVFVCSGAEEFIFIITVATKFSETCKTCILMKIYLNFFTFGEVDFWTSCKQGKRVIAIFIVIHAVLMKFYIYIMTLDALYITMTVEVFCLIKVHIQITYYYNLRGIEGRVLGVTEIAIDELKKYPEVRGYNLRTFFAPAYFGIATDLIELAEQLKLPEEDREDNFKSDNIELVKDIILEKKREGISIIFSILSSIIVAESSVK